MPLTTAYDTKDLPDNRAKSISALRSALLAVTLQDLKKMAEISFTPTPINKPAKPNVSTRLCKEFNIASGAVDDYARKKAQQKIAYNNNTAVRKSIAMSVILKLAEGQPQTVENLWRARETALEQTKTDLFATDTKEYRVRRLAAIRTIPNNVLNFPEPACPS
jgi:hypothetical protein